MDEKWNPNDPLLTSAAPHEIAGVLRWHRAGVPSQKLARLLRLRGTRLVKELEKAREQERAAVFFGHPIHDPLISKEDK